MDILYLLVPLSLAAVVLVAAIFWWTLHRGQFDDLEGPAHVFDNQCAVDFS